MHLPEELREAITLEADKFKLKEILVARTHLTECYRNLSKKKGAYIGSEAERCAYIISRLPATFGVICRVFTELSKRIDTSIIQSVLDLGAGPGTTMWAAHEILPKVSQYSLVEQDSALMAIGQRLSKEAPFSFDWKWYLQNMEHLKGIAKHDLVVLSYSIGELEQQALQPLIQTCWELSNHYLVVIEPGTPKGFERIRDIRDQLIQLGGFLVAPCPQAGTCPMEGGNWCHFSQRIDRSSLHRQIKGGTLGYEDEKFSYLIASKAYCPLPDARVLRHPQKHSGHVTLELCTHTGLEKRLISKRIPQEYKRARKLDWGSSIESGAAYAE